MKAINKYTKQEHDVLDFSDSSSERYIFIRKSPSGTPQWHTLHDYSIVPEKGEEAYRIRVTRNTVHDSIYASYVSELIECGKYFKLKTDRKKQQLFNSKSKADIMCDKLNSMNSSIKYEGKSTDLKFSVEKTYNIVKIY